MSNTKSISDVKDYWQNNPVHTVEFEGPVYDLKYLQSIDQLRWNDNERWSLHSIYNFFPKNGQEKLLDAGCGIGVFTRLYAERGFDVHSVDITDMGVEVTKKSLSELNLNANVVLGSVEELPFEDNTFDYIVSNGVIHHTENTENAVKEFYRVLRPGGKAAVSIYYKNALLRPPIWWLARLALRFMLKNQKAEGREKMLNVKTPEDLAKIYDGNETPIARIYTKEESDKLFAAFKVHKCEAHFFPARFLRFLPVKIGGTFHKLLDRWFGFLIYYVLEKPAEKTVRKDEAA